MTVRYFDDREFQHMGLILPDTDSTGAVLELMPQHRYKNAATLPLHAYGSGPFCRFRIGRDRKEQGLYVLCLDGDPVYAGECVNLGKRWSSNGYGGISPRNCFVGGQPTNCRVNAAILDATRKGSRIDLWFSQFGGNTQERQSVESKLIQSLKPPWNRAKLNKARS